jgi:DhnA family fructose-bisphosphate aldolase class Ia
MQTATDRLSQKLNRIRSGSYRPQDFIIADAKDGDMGGGAGAMGIDPDTGMAYPASVYRTAMKEMVTSGLSDIMLMSLSSAESLAADDIFTASDVTPAVRLNESTDIWGHRGAVYRNYQARPFQTARMDRARALCDLGLYAVTFYNDVDRDVPALNAYSEFRDQASAAGMRHFLEVFNPAFPIDTAGEEIGIYINDAIVRCLAGVAKTERPLFLKVQFNGARAMEELAGFDPENLTVGILGGSAGTTRDTFELIRQAERFGARVALFGRKIYFAEDSVEIVRSMRRIIEGELSCADAVKAYHDHLQRSGLTPIRSLEDDLHVTDPILMPEAK